ncbi:copper uptake system-associated protein [Burkholderia metallica]|uniref:copper uptake system-associated protein n=1 Tax=Burkholderia metallica TaxID=488729 RepID=UPI001CF5BDEE|nr:copper uptake system-associated protein [Burkholderia metallica]MCA8000125.1 copper uptake system-associated protein [Burkholderia metallica]
MKRFFPIHSLAGRIACGIALAVATANACAADAPPSAAMQIAQLLSRTYDSPDRHVVTEAVALAGKFAIADWTQRDMAGRALLRVVNDHWTIVTCGGAALKDHAWLTDAGVPPADVHVLLSRLADAERPMLPVTVARFDRFRMPADVPSASGGVAH